MDSFSVLKRINPPSKPVCVVVVVICGSIGDGERIQITVTDYMIDSLSPNIVET